MEDRSKIELSGPLYSGKKLNVMVYSGGPFAISLLGAFLQRPVLGKYFDLRVVLTDKPPYGNTMKRIWGLIQEAFTGDRSGEFKDIASACRRFAKEYEVPVFQKAKFESRDVDRLMGKYQIDLAISAISGYIWPGHQLRLLQGHIYNFHPVGFIHDPERPGINKGQELRVGSRYAGKEAVQNTINDLLSRKIKAMEIVMHQATKPVDTGRILGRSGAIAHMPFPSSLPKRLGKYERIRRFARMNLNLLTTIGTHIGPVAEAYLPWYVGAVNTRPEYARDLAELQADLWPLD